MASLPTLAICFWDLARGDGCTFKHISRPGNWNSFLVCRSDITMTQQWHNNFLLFTAGGILTPAELFRFPSHHAERVLSISSAWLNPPQLFELRWQTTQNYVRDITKLLIMWHRAKGSHRFKPTDYEWNSMPPMWRHPTIVFTFRRNRGRHSWTSEEGEEKTVSKVVGTNRVERENKARLAEERLQRYQTNIYTLLLVLQQYSSCKEVFPPSWG